MRSHATASFAALLVGTALVAIACGDSGDTTGTTSTTSTGGSGTGANGTGGAATTSTGGAGTGGATTGTGGAGGATNGTGGAGGSGTGGGCVGTLPPITTAPMFLSDTGLYSDITTDTIAAYIKSFQPRFPLWSDGAVKERWAYIPECAQIDTTDMDFWQMPVGARFWKQFTRDGIRVETRFITRTGTGPSDFVYATYKWDSNDEATLINDGEDNVLGTTHDIPPQALCSSCHKAPWRILGFSAIQLSHSLGGENMASLSNDGVLTTPAPAGFTVPGSSVEQEALGYLHANCGNCHQDGGVTNTAMRLRLFTTDTTVAGTKAYDTTVNKVAQVFSCGGCDLVEPGDPSASAIIQRIGVRNTGQMPPLATEVVDATGVSAVTAWIQAIPP
jgi:hypothetical protein